MRTAKRRNFIDQFKAKVALDTERINKPDNTSELHVFQDQALARPMGSHFPEHRIQNGLWHYASYRFNAVNRRGEGLHVFRIAPEDLPQFQAFRETMLAAQSGEGSGSLSVDAALCRTRAALPDAVPLTIWLDVA